MDRREFSRQFLRGAAGVSVAAAGGMAAAGVRAGDTVLEQLSTTTGRLAATVSQMGERLEHVGGHVEHLGARVERVVTLQRALLFLLLLSYLLDGGMLYTLLSAPPIPVA